jgi:ADP-heptose:LPS heptosyltransferase
MTGAPPADPRPLLVVLRALGLGDFLTGVPALRALAAAFGDHRRILAAPAVLAPLAELSGAVDGVVDTRPLAPLHPSLHGADIAVNLHGRGPESSRLLVDARPRRLIAFAHPEVAETAGGPPWVGAEHEVDRWCRLLESAGIAADPSLLDLPAPRTPAPAAARGATIVHPGAASGARRWPPERWAAVAAAEVAAGHRVVVTGGAGEADLAADVAARAGLGPDAVLAGRTDLAALAAVVAAAARVVCADTGLAHLATALATPSVVLFGPVSPSRWGPPPGRPEHVVLWAGTLGDPHASEPDPGLLRITVEDVVAALHALPARLRPAQELMTSTIRSTWSL